MCVRESVCGVAGVREAVGRVNGVCNRPDFPLK